jgi:hypothetical protein
MKNPRQLVDPKEDLRRFGPVWRRIAKYAEDNANNTMAAKLFWRELSLGEGVGCRNVSAGAKKVKELRKARISNKKPFDGRFKADHPTIEYSSDYNDYLPDDDFETCCPLAEINPKKKIRTEPLSITLTTSIIVTLNPTMEEEESTSKTSGLNCFVVSEAENMGAISLLWLKSKYV